MFAVHLVQPLRLHSTSAAEYSGEPMVQPDRCDQQDQAKDKEFPDEKFHSELEIDECFCLREYTEKADRSDQQGIRGITEYRLFQE